MEDLLDLFEGAFEFIGELIADLLDGIVKRVERSIYDK